MEVMEAAALGRPFSLGMLYDCRSERLIPGITLWKAEALERVSTRTQENTDFEVLTSDSLSDKWTAMNVSGSLKVSFLFGMVDVGGSAKYLKDTKAFRQSTRVTLKYMRSTRFEQLNMSHLGDDSLTFPGVMERSGATHVVTAILYGAQAFFIFDEDAVQSQSTGNLHCSLNLKALVKKLPMASGDLPMNNKEKEEVSKFRCTFYGDFALEKNPASFEEAVKLYASLPKLLGAKGEKAVPLKVWLYPLSHLDARAERLVREISDGLVFRAENLLQQMSEAMMQCNELMSHPATDRFPVLLEKVQRFQELCHHFTNTFQKQLSQALPSVRSGAIRESELENVLSSTEQTPFGSQKVRTFLKRLQEEMDAVLSYLKVLPDVRVLTTPGHLQRALLDQDFRFTVCFNLSTLHGSDLCLNIMEDWLRKDRSDPITAVTRITQWFEDTSGARRARRLLKSFQSFVQENSDSKETQFLISSINLEKPRISILLYEDGDLETPDWMPPAQPIRPQIKCRSHHTMDLLLQPSECGRESVEGYRVEYKPVTAATWIPVDRIYPSQDEVVVVSGLEVNSWYHFRYSVVCKVGVSPFSETSTSEKTLCTSPPGAPKVKAAANALQVSWRPPHTMSYETISSFRVEYRELGTNTWLHTRTSDKNPICRIRGLRPSTTYSIHVIAVCRDEESLASEETEATTMAEGLEENTLLCGEEDWDPRYEWDGACRESAPDTNKVILLVGDTGSGKAALLDALANHLHRVKWEDDFRLKLPKADSHVSDQSEVREYLLMPRPGSQVPYSLTLLDAPPFGDPQRPEQNKEVIRAIRDILTGQSIPAIHAICFVVRAFSDPLTTSQIEVFTLLCSLLGKDMKENLKILITSCDAAKPPVLNALKAAGLPFPLDQQGDPVHYKFNTSALTVPNDDQFHRWLWEAGEEALRRFCASLETMEAGSLRKTLEVMRDLKGLEGSLQALSEQLMDKSVIKHEIKTLERRLQSSRRQMGDNQDYEDFPELSIVTCAQCDFICHYDCHCLTGHNPLLQQCSAMDWRGQCQQCPGQCTWRLHFVQGDPSVAVIDWDKKRAHEASSGEFRELSEKIQGLQETLSQITQQEELLLEECLRTSRRLHGSAMCRAPLLTSEAIRQMIHPEDIED